MSKDYEKTFSSRSNSQSYPSKASDYEDSYKSSIAPRQLIIQRSSTTQSSLSRPKFGGSGSFLQQALTSHPGAYASLTSSGIQTVVSSGDQEKKDMQDLNDRFGNYIEKVRFLEVQNRELANELEKLKARWGTETTQIKAMYQAELDEARKMLDDAEKDKARFKIRSVSLEEQLEESRRRNGIAVREIEELKDRVEKLSTALNKAEADVGPLKRRNEVLEADKIKDKENIDQLRDSFNAARMNLDTETLCHVDAENRKQTLEEELKFMKEVHEQEMKELAAIAYRDTTPENREFWKNEMGQALRDIREIYDEKIDTMKSDLESYYSLKVQEFTTKATKGGMEADHAKEEVTKLRERMSELRRKNGDLENKLGSLQRENSYMVNEREDGQRNLETENKNLKMEIAKLRAEMEAILKELQTIIDTKLSLELEIAAYRKLLEIEENRVGLRQTINESILGKGKFTISDHYSGTEENNFTHKVSSTEPIVLNENTGPYKLVDCARDGTYVELENLGYKNLPLEGYKISRSVDGKKVAEHSFARKQTIQAGDKIKVWAKNQKPLSAAYSDLETTFKSWEVGAKSFTSLVDSDGKEVASHNMRMEK